MPDSFQNPVGGKDPYGHYRAEEIQKDKHEREQSAPSSERPLLAAFIINVFKKFFELFEKNRTEKPFAYSQADLRAHLMEMKELFESLETEDHSQDVSFLQKLSRIWASILEDKLQFPRRSILAVKMEALIHSILDYPEGREHTLGYYLSEYAGQKWMPFPYMEIIQGLWEEHQKEAEASRLSGWCRDLGEILNLVSSE